MKSPYFLVLHTPEATTTLSRLPRRRKAAPPGGHSRIVELVAAMGVLVKVF